MGRPAKKTYPEIRESMEGQLLLQVYKTLPTFRQVLTRTRVLTPVDDPNATEVIESSEKFHRQIHLGLGRQFTTTIPQYKADQEVFHAVCAYAFLSWAFGGRHILRMSADLARKYCERERCGPLPNPLPKLPFSAFYLEASGWTTLFDPDSGIHEVEGVCVFPEEVVDLAGQPVQRLDLLIVGKGKVKPVMLGYETRTGVKPVLDDTLRYTAIAPGGPGEERTDVTTCKDALRLVLNFLDAYNNALLNTTAVVPDVPRNPKKLRRLMKELGGEVSTRRYLYVSERPVVRSVPPRVELAPKPTEPSALPIGVEYGREERSIRDHGQRYWVSEVPAGYVAIEQKETKNGIRYCIRREKKSYDRAVRVRKTSSVRIHQVK